MSETIEQLEARHAAELQAFYFIKDDVKASKAAAEAHVATDCPKITAAGLTIGDEVKNSHYVTINLPDETPANWSLIRMAMNSNELLKAIDETGVLRVHKARTTAVLNFIEANLS
tara:strand:+ start:696 stop:1040 length:345 start_codon:yes stop_codon:yes gene_type:complete